MRLASTATLVWASMLTAAMPVFGQSAADSKAAPRIVNIINFIRGVEPRLEMDLYEPVVQQIRLVHEHKLPATFLLQYDALTQPRFTDLLRRELTDRDEIGAWLEVVQPQVEAAGLKWRGRFPWDWHTDVGFTIGYTPAERQKLIDVYMDQFKKVFGRLPRSVGCWVLDAPTLNYLADKYGIVAACVCKDQCGTDGYTLWGGYWNQAYYPSRLNAYMPAQSSAQQLNVPVFRMLGSDPIYQYDHGLGLEAQGVVSLEPVYKGGGGNPDWVRWFFDTNFRAPCLAFGYAQVGQENSFGWPDMSKGLTDQVKLLAEGSKAGKLRVETLESSGQWFRRTHDKTPATTVTALKDWQDKDRRSIWYNSRFYRANFFWDGADFRIRDLHLFNEKYPERYLKERVTTHACTYDTLPALDGFNWSTQDDLAGIRVVSIAADGTRRVLQSGEPTVQEVGKDSLLVTIPLQPTGELKIHCEPKGMRMEMGGPNPPASWGLEMAWSKQKTAAITDIQPNTVDYRHNDFGYRLDISKGNALREPSASAVLIKADGPDIALDLDCTR